MVEDKYIGLVLAMSSSLAIGTSFIITKKGLNDAADRQSAYASASDDYAYLKNPIWWAGISTLVLGELANFAAYSFAPPILVTPLGALSVIIGAILASYLLKEELGHLGRVGCALCLIGSLIIILHAPEDKDIETVDEVLRYAVQPGFLMYCFSVLVFSLVMIYSVAPRYGRSNPLVYISICSLVGSVSIMAVKGFGIAVKLTIAGNNQFTYLSTYVFGAVVAGCIMVQMNYFNKALDIFSTNVVNPMYYVCFSTATIVASLILFQGFNTDNPTNTVSLIAGFVVTFLGIHILELSRKPESAAANGHSALEGGLMNPRLSLQGRASLDDWSAPVPGSAGLTHARRASRNSLYRSQTATLFNAFEDDEADGEAVGLHRLSEEDDELEAVNERTRLRGDRENRSREGSGAPGSRHVSRSNSNSASPHGSQGDLRRS